MRNVCRRTDVLRASCIIDLKNTLIVTYEHIHDEHHFDPDASGKACLGLRCSPIKDRLHSSPTRQWDLEIHICSQIWHELEGGGGGAEPTNSVVSQQIFI